MSFSKKYSIYKNKCFSRTQLRDRTHVVSFTELVLYIAIVHLTIKKIDLMIPERFRAVPGDWWLGGARTDVPECQGCCGSVREAPGGFPRHASSSAATADNQERSEANQRLRRG